MQQSTILAGPKSSRRRCRRHAVDKNPKKPQFHYHLGLAYAKQGEDSKAIAALKRALTISPTFDGANEAKRTLVDLEIQ